MTAGGRNWHEAYLMLLTASFAVSSWATASEQQAIAATFPSWGRSSGSRCSRSTVLRSPSRRATSTPRSPCDTSTWPTSSASTPRRCGCSRTGCPRAAVQPGEDAVLAVGVDMPQHYCGSQLARRGSVPVPACLQRLVQRRDLDRPVRTQPEWNQRGRGVDRLDAQRDRFGLGQRRHRGLRRGR